MLMKRRESQTLCTDGSPNLQDLHLCDSVQDFKTPVVQTTAICENRDSDSAPLPKRLSQWESLSPRNVPEEMRLPPKPTVNRVAVAHSGTIELNRFERFIRRMQSAGPKIIIDRLREDWGHLAGDVADEEV